MDEGASDIHDAADEVSKNRLHEEELGQELGPDELRLLEVEVVEDLKADGERHLHLPNALATSAKVDDEEERTWITPITTLIFILSELVKIRALSVPCQAGSIPKG
jgi:hypothetical protein